MNTGEGFFCNTVTLDKENNLSLCAEKKQTQISLNCTESSPQQQLKAMQGSKEHEYMEYSSDLFFSSRYYSDWS